MLLKPLKFSFPNKGHRLSRSLIGCWLFNEGSGGKVADLSGNKNEGTINQATWIAGPEGSALNLAGDPQRVNAPGPTQGIPLTIIIRCRPDNVAATGTVVGFGTTGYFTQFAIQMQSIGKWRTITFNDLAESKSCTEPTASISAGEWCTVAGVWYSTTDYRLYINGREVAKATVDIGAISSANNVVIGAYVNLGNYFDGGVSYQQIYNRALSAADIASLNRNPFQMFEQSQIEHRPSA